MNKLAITVLAALIVTTVASVIVPSPSYANSWLWRQQAVRQNQMAQQRQMQRQAQQQRQARQAQQRRQQQAMQQQRARQQKAMRVQQQRMRQQMVKRQQTAARQRQAMAQKQRNLQLQRQKRIQTNRPKNLAQRAAPASSSSKQKVLQQQRTLRQQRLAKQRADRLKRLRLERQKSDQKTARNNQSTNAVAMSAVASRIRSTPRQTIKATDRSNFRKTRLSQQNQTKLTKQLADQRKFVQTRAKKLLEQQRKLKFQNKKPSVSNNRTKQVQAKAKQQFRNCNGKSCECSFHGDTNVLTDEGLVAIKDIVAGQSRVWARSEFSGESAWKLVTNHYSNIYETMIDLEIVIPMTGEIQTIRTNKLHPFFVTNNFRSVSLMSGINRYSGKWVAADKLNIGDSLSTATDSNAVITKINEIIKPFEAYNLTVKDFHTYFVQGKKSKSSNSVWVHNDCENTKSSESFSKNRYINGLAGLSKPQAKIALKTAQNKYKGSTVVGHALSKHAGKTPQIWGKTHGNPSTWNKQAMKHVRQVFRAPGNFKKVKTDTGLTFLEKRLKDGRGIRLNLDHSFKGFLSPKLKNRGNK